MENQHYVVWSLRGNSTWKINIMLYVLYGKTVNGWALENTLEDLLMRLGDYDYFEVEDTEELRRVSKIKLHNKFDYDTFDKDIALVKLARPVDEFTDFIRPICLLNYSFAGEIVRPGAKGRIGSRLW